MAERLRVELLSLSESRNRGARLDSEREREAVGWWGARAQHAAVEQEGVRGGVAGAGERADEGVVAEGGRFGDLIEQAARVGGGGGGSEELGEREGVGEAREAEPE